MATRIYHERMPNTTVVAVNSDPNSIRGVEADRRILIGNTVTKGKDAGGFPEVGERCAELSSEEIKDAMMGSDVVYVVTTLGGGTGTGVAPYVAKLAREDGRVVVSVVVKPFSFEDRPTEDVERAIETIRSYSHSTVVLENDYFMSVPDMTVERAFDAMDRQVISTIRETTQRMDMDFLFSMEEIIPELLEEASRLFDSDRERKDDVPLTVEEGVRTEDAGETEGAGSEAVEVAVAE